MKPPMPCMIIRIFLSYSIIILQIQAYKLLTIVHTIYLTTLQGQNYGVQNAVTTPQPLT